MRARAVLIAAGLALAIIALGVAMFWSSFERKPPEDPSLGGGRPDAAARAGAGGATRPDGAGSGSGTPERGPGGKETHRGLPGVPGRETGSPPARTGGPIDAEGKGGKTASGDAREGPPDHPKPLGSGNSSLSIIVTDPDGNPFPGVGAEIRGSGGYRTGATGPEGAADFSKIPSGSYEVILRPPETVPLRSSRPVDVAEGERAEVRCQVPAFDGEIRGRVHDSAGNPVPGIEIQARAIALPGSGMSFVPEQVPLPGAVATSGPEGEFLLSGLPRVEHSISTREVPAYPSARVTAIAGSDEPVDILLAEKRVLAISGTVQDPSRRPVENAAVHAITHSASPAFTGAEGRFRLEVRYERGPVLVSARKQGYAAAEAMVPAAEIGDREEVQVALVLEPEGATGDLEGLVTDLDGAGVPGMAVHLHSPSLNATYRGVSRQDGGYSVRNARAAEDYRVWVSPERGYRDFSQAPVGIAEGSNRLDIALTPIETGSLKGTLVDPDGRPVARRTLWARSTAASLNSVSLTSDDRGRFSARDVPAGDILLETRAAPLVSVRGIRLEAGEEKEVEVLLGLGEGRLEGRVTGRGGEAVPAARITLHWSAARGALQSAVLRETSSDAAGRFAFTGIARGRGSIAISAPGYRDHRETKDLSGKAEELPPIALQEAR